MPRLLTGIDQAVRELSVQEFGFRRASEAILTTDSGPKVVSRKIPLGNGPATLLGLAKGAAMIGPNMATMLGVLLSDARVSPGMLQGILADTVDDSFNCISVGGAHEHQRHGVPGLLPGPRPAPRWPARTSGSSATRSARLARSWPG